MNRSSKELKCKTKIHTIHFHNKCISHIYFNYMFTLYISLENDFYIPTLLFSGNQDSCST